MFSFHSYQTHKSQRPERQKRQQPERQKGPIVTSTPLPGLAVPLQESESLSNIESPDSQQTTLTAESGVEPILSSNGSPMRPRAAPVLPNVPVVKEETRYKQAVFVIETNSYVVFLYASTCFSSNTNNPVVLFSDVLKFRQ